MNINFYEPCKIKLTKTGAMVVNQSNKLWQENIRKYNHVMYDGYKPNEEIEKIITEVFQRYPNRLKSYLQNDYYVDEMVAIFKMFCNYLNENNEPMEDMFSLIGGTFDTCLIEEFNNNI